MSELTPIVSPGFRYDVTDCVFAVFVSSYTVSMSRYTAEEREYEHMYALDTTSVNICSTFHFTSPNKMRFKISETVYVGWFNNPLILGS